MKIIFTSSYKTYLKNNTKNHVTNYYVLVFLISMIFFSYNMGRNCKNCISMDTFKQKVATNVFMETLKKDINRVIYCNYN